MITPHFGNAKSRKDAHAIKAAFSCVNFYGQVLAGSRVMSSTLRPIMSW